VKFERAKFQQSTPKGTFSNWREIEEEGRKMCIFNGKLAISQKRWNIQPRLLL